MITITDGTNIEIVRATISDDVFRQELDTALKRQGIKKAGRSLLIEAALVADPETRDAVLEIELEKARQHQDAIHTGVPLEKDEQIRFVEWFRKTYPDARIGMCRNDGFRTNAEKSEQMVMGLWPGMSDLCIPIPGGMLWVEMKRIKGSEWREEQQAFAAYVESLPGHYYLLCYGAEDAKQKVLDFFK